MSGGQADALEADGSSWDQPISLQAFAIERVVGHDDCEVVRIETSSKYFSPWSASLLRDSSGRNFTGFRNVPFFYLTKVLKCQIAPGLH